MALAEQLDRYQSCFPGSHLELVLASMTVGNTAGHLWTVPQEGAPPLLLLWDKGNNVFYLAGDCTTQSSLSSLADVVTSQVRPQAFAERTPHFKVRALSSSLEEGLPYIFPGIALRASPTLFFMDDAARHMSVAPPVLHDVALVPITQDVLTHDGFAHSDDVLDEIRWMWPSEDHFYMHGFGTLATLRDEIICWCTAEYMGPTHCGIGITTLPQYERRGVATATAASFVHEARQRNLIACWECGVANYGSVRVAEKVGFVRRTEETFWIGSFAE